MITLISILGFGFVFSLFDYIFYNYFTKRGWCSYRIVQTIFQLILVAIAYYLFGWIAAAGFILLWWTWNCDLLYYCFEWIFLYEGYTTLRSEVFRMIDMDSVTWAWWTPLGLYLCLRKKERRALTHLQIYWQAIAGNILIVLGIIIK